MAMSRIRKVEKKYKELLSIPNQKRTFEDGVWIETLYWVLEVLGRKDYTPEMTVCAYPACTNAFPVRKGKKYCSNSCRVNDFNRKKRWSDGKSRTTKVPVDEYDL